MSAILTPDSDAYGALRDGVDALRQLAEYRLPPHLQRRMHDLGENKEFLSPEQHAELVELVEFSQGLNVEKLKAMLAIKRLRESVPSLFESS